MSVNSVPAILEKVYFNEIDSPLLAYRRNVASQDGEDGIIDKIFDVVGTKNKYCIEFGAWDGKHLSNCWNLIANQNWGGCFIEGNAEKYGQLERNIAQYSHVVCVNTFIDVDGDNCLDRVLERCGAPLQPDFLSIDVDGVDYHIWASLTRYSPRVVVIEFNPSVPNDVIFVQASNLQINQGSSLLALILLAKQKGYELVCCTTCNAFFVQRDLYGLFGIVNNGINVMYRPISDGRIFHGYDSYIFVTGMPKMLWSDIPVNSSDFQVIPEVMRRFGDAQR
ncbi:MAG: hypothetical protein ACK6DW_12480 [Betaproteobacteria bacterium]